MCRFFLGLILLVLPCVGASQAYGDTGANESIASKNLAATPSKAFLPLSDALKQAKDTSPDIQQLQAQYESAIRKTNLALSPSEPTFSVFNNDMIGGLHLGTAASQVMQIQQTIGFPGRALLNRSQLSEQARALLYQEKAMELQIAVNVKTAYYNLQLAQRNIQLNEDTKLAYERVMQIAQRRYESGAAAQVDVINAQIALVSNDNDLNDLQTAEKVARAQLNVLLKQPVDTVVTVEPIKMTYFAKVDLAEAAQQMMQNRNEIKAAKAGEKASEKAYQLAWMSLLPDFQFTIGRAKYLYGAASPYNPMAPAPYPTETYMAGVQFSVPLWFLFNEREVINGASYDRAAAQRNLDVVSNQSKVALETAVDTIHSNEQKIKKFETRILPLSDQAFNLALTDYSSGRIDFQTLSDTATSRRQARINYATAVVTYLTSYATYEQLIGEDLQ
jgi:outer membrane protein TolC